MIEVLLFDLCDTVVRTAGLGALRRLPGLVDRGGEEALSRWFQRNPVYFAYERGQASTEEFLGSLRTGLGVTADPGELARAYEGLILREIDGMGELLERWSRRYPLYALSNNNPLLWRGVVRVCPSLRWFARIFLSHETGLLKPEPAAFQHVLAQIGCAPDQVALVDDSPASVEQARQLGMIAVLFQGPVQTQQALERLSGAGPPARRKAC